MNSLNIKQSYSEVYAFINALGEPYISKTPKSFIEILKKEMDETYIVETPINPHNFTKDSIAIISLINLNYWCDTENQRNKLIQVYKENDVKEQKELKEKYRIDNIFENNQIKKPDITKNDVLDIHPVIRKSFIEKIIDKIKKFFKKY
ncbi:MAG: hypothetical protein HFJ45_03685 [Clostridia bacterium]|nr:hypothetical protein [Clostridia bacterium]